MSFGQCRGTERGKRYGYKNDGILYRALAGIALIKVDAASKAAENLGKAFKPPVEKKKKIDLEKEIRKFSDSARRNSERFVKQGRHRSFTPRQNYIRALAIEALIEKGFGLTFSKSKGNARVSLFSQKFKTDATFFKALKGLSLLEDYSGKKAAEILKRKFEPPPKIKKTFDLEETIEKFDKFAKENIKRLINSKRRHNYTEKQNYIRKLCIEALHKLGEEIPSNKDRSNSISENFELPSNASFYRALAGRRKLDDKQGIIAAKILGKAYAPPLAHIDSIEKKVRQFSDKAELSRNGKVYLLDLLKNENGYEIVEKASHSQVKKYPYDIAYGSTRDDLEYAKVKTSSYDHSANLILNQASLNFAVMRYETLNDGNGYFAPINLDKNKLNDKFIIYRIHNFGKHNQDFSILSPSDLVWSERATAKPTKYMVSLKDPEEENKSDELKLDAHNLEMIENLNYYIRLTRDHNFFNYVKELANSMSHDKGAQSIFINEKSDNLGEWLENQDGSSGLKSDINLLIDLFSKVSFINKGQSLEVKEEPVTSRIRALASEDEELKERIESLNCVHKF